MSSSTSRLQLTKLADGENFSNTVLNANWDKVDNGYGTLNSQLEITGTVTSVQALATSGTNVSYAATSSGWYSIQVVTGNTSGSSDVRFQVGNTTIMQTSKAMGQYDTFLPPPMFIKSGTSIKGMATFPSNASANIVKIT